MNVQTICRICISNNLEMLSIFEPYNFSGDNRDVFKVITNCASVQIKEFDGFSGKICRRCLEHLSQAYSFKKLCEESDYKFRNNLIVSDEIEIKSEFSEPIITYGGNKNVDEIQNKLTDIEFIEVNPECSEDDAYGEISKCADKQCKIEIFDLYEVEEEQCRIENKTDNKPNETETDELDVFRGSSASIDFKEVSCLKKEEKRYKCHVCDRQFSRNGNLKVHMRTHSAEKPYKCKFCEKAFKTNRDSLNHTRLHHQTREKPHMCDYCGKQFTLTSDLTKHITNTHTGKKPYKCEFCEKTFSHKYVYMEHTMLHTGKKPFKCELCEEEFTQRVQLDQHIKLHKGQEVFNCEFCQKKFTSMTKLKTHIRCHSGEKPFKCDFCEKRCTTKSNLVSHLRMHTGEQPYKCEFCGKKFTQSSNLAKHFRVHTGEKPYKCDVCHKLFAESSTLSEHARIHTGEKHYQCHVCGKQFTQGTTLRNHRRMHARENQSSVKH